MSEATDGILDGLVHIAGVRDVERGRKHLFWTHSLEVIQGCVTARRGDNAKMTSPSQVTRYPDASSAQDGRNDRIRCLDNWRCMARRSVSRRAEFLAEDAGFEPARVLTQHDFQTCKPAVQRRQTRLTSDAGRECLQTMILYTDQKTT